MPRTAVFVPDTSIYDDDVDPLTQDEWAQTSAPVALHGDGGHFYQASDELFALRKNPLTRAPLELDDIQPIVHPRTRRADYIGQLRALRERGWEHPEHVAADVRAMYASGRAATGKRRPRQKREEDDDPELLSHDVYQVEPHALDAYARNLWRAATDPCPVIETDAPEWSYTSLPKLQGVGRTNGAGRPPSRFMIEFERDGRVVCRCRMPAGSPDAPAFAEYFDTEVYGGTRSQFRYRIVATQSPSSPQRFLVDCSPNYLHGFHPRVTMSDAGVSIIDMSGKKRQASVKLDLDQCGSWVVRAVCVAK